MIEQKINLKLCFKLGKAPTETYSMLVRFYEDQALSMSVCTRGSSVFEMAGKVLLSIPVAIERVTSVSDENIEKMSKLIMKDLR